MQSGCTVGALSLWLWHRVAAASTITLLVLLPIRCTPSISVSRQLSMRLPCWSESWVRFWARASMWSRKMMHGAAAWACHGGGGVRAVAGPVATAWAGQ